MTTLKSVTLERPAALIRDQVAAYLRDAITSFELKPGTVLVEREICAVTGTSRATVREALRQLQSEGMVVSEVGRGTTVASLTEAETRQIYQVRGALEGLAARLFTENATPQQVDELAASVREMGKWLEEPLRMLAIKGDFYDTLFTGAGNVELHRLWEGTRRRATLVRATSLSIPGRPQRSLDEIESIMTAIRDRNGELAEVRTGQHIEAAAAAILGAEDSLFARASDRGRSEHS